MADRAMCLVVAAIGLNSVKAAGYVIAPAGARIKAAGEPVTHERPV